MRIVRPTDRAAYWSEGTRSELALVAAPVSVLEEWMPAASGPPLHSHPEAEIYHVLDGRLTVWVMSPTPPPFDEWAPEQLDTGVDCGPGDTVFIPGGAAHCYRVDGDGPAHVLVLSHPAGLETWSVRFGVPATTAGMPPPDAPAPVHSREEIIAFSREHGVRRLGPPAPDHDVVAEAPSFVTRLENRARSISEGVRTEEALAARVTGGRITLHEQRFPPHGRLPTSHAATETVYLVREGDLTVVTDDHSVGGGAGTSILVPAGTSHGVEVGDEGARVLVIGALSPRGELLLRHPFEGGQGG